MCDALVLSNWGTFYKNLVFLLFAFIVVRYRKEIVCFGGVKTGIVLAGISILVYAVSVVWSYRHEPVFDFRPYKAGVNIQDGMTIPTDAPKDVYENTFYYKNKETGQIKSLPEEITPGRIRSTGNFQKSDQILISKGYEPPIHGFTIESRDGDNVYDFFLNDENYVFMLIAYNLDKSSTKNQDKINQLARWTKQQNYSFICLTSSLTVKSDLFSAMHETPYEYFNCDEITLKPSYVSQSGFDCTEKRNHYCQISLQ